MAGGLGLTAFRNAMLTSGNLRELVDYQKASDVFPSVKLMGGVSYFLHDKTHHGPCRVSYIRGEETIGPHLRDLSEHDVLVRDFRSLKILRKILKKGDPSITEILSVDKEFGWTSNFTDFDINPVQGDVPLYYVTKGKRLLGSIPRAKISKSVDLVDTWKVLVPKARGGESVPDVVLGKPLLVGSPSVCTQTYLFFYLKSKSEAESLQSYIFTKFFRFLVSLRKITQDATKSTYTWVPSQSWDRIWTDKELYKLYDLDDEDIQLIESQIKDMDLENA
jgi:site-specific DNA-methyltransferase (adenine-specific)